MRLGVRQGVLEIKQFLRVNLYRHPQVNANTSLARQVVRELFEAYLADPVQMRQQDIGDRSTPRAVADYIAGMTDRFALTEHQRLTGASLQWPQRASAR